jgi:hypothetical protein
LRSAGAPHGKDAAGSQRDAGLVRLQSLPADVGGPGRSRKPAITPDPDSTPMIPHYRAGALRLLVQTTERRSPGLPDIPTFQEAGIKGLVINQWIGVFVPAGTPAAIVDRLNVT